MTWHVTIGRLSGSLCPVAAWPAPGASLQRRGSAPAGAPVKRAVSPLCTPQSLPSRLLHGYRLYIASAVHIGAISFHRSKMVEFISFGNIHVDGPEPV